MANVKLSRPPPKEARTLFHRPTSTQQGAHIQSHGNKMIQEPSTPGADLTAQPEGASGRQGPTPDSGCPTTLGEAAHQPVLGASSLQLIRYAASLHKGHSLSKTRSLFYPSWVRLRPVRGGNLSALLGKIWTHRGLKGTTLGNSLLFSKV